MILKKTKITKIIGIMSVEREIGNLIRSIAQVRKDDIYVTTVMSVKGNTCTVERESDCRKFENVNLNASGNDQDSLIITPCST